MWIPNQYDFSYTPKTCWNSFGLELRAAVYAQRFAGNPARRIRCEKRDCTANVIGLRNPFQRLHADGHPASLVSLRETRHLGCDYTGRHRIHADTACAASDDSRTMLLPLHITGSSCCTRK